MDTSNQPTIYAAESLNTSPIPSIPPSSRHVVTAPESQARSGNAPASATRLRRRHHNTTYCRYNIYRPSMPPLPLLPRGTRNSSHRRTPRMSHTPRHAVTATNDTLGRSLPWLIAIDITEAGSGKANVRKAGIGWYGMPIFCYVILRPQFENAICHYAIYYC